MEKNGSVVWAWSALIPSLALILGIVAYPFFTGISLSLHQVILTRSDLGRPFVWLANFQRMFADPVIATAAWNTAIYVVVGVASQLLLGLGAALLLHRRTKHIWIARTAIMLPWFLPPVATAYMSVFMLDPRYGIITRLLGVLGIQFGDAGVFANPSLALGGALAVELWKSYPFFALFLLAGLQAIPEELREASSLDGASRFRHFLSITWPLLQPVILVSVLLEGIKLANSPTLLLLLTNGGPGNATQTLSLYAFQQAYTQFDFGYAASIAVAMFAVVIGFSIVSIRLSARSQKT